MEAIIELVKEGSVPIYLNIFISIVVLGTIIDRGIALGMHHLQVKPENFMRAITTMVKNGQLDQAIKLSKYTKHALCRVAYAGLVKANSTAMEISMAIDLEVMRITPDLEKRIAGLFQLANIATLLGLIGTIIGLIKCFAGLAAVSPDQKTVFLANGISEALYNTAVGLTIAVSCMIGQFILTGLSKKALADVETNSVALENFLLLRNRTLGVQQEASDMKTGR